MQNNKKGLKYIEEIKQLTSLQIENCKNNLIRVKNDLIEKFKKNNRTKKAGNGYYEYEKNTFYGLKDVRYLFDQNDDDDIYEGIEYLLNESMMKQNGLEYEEIIKFMSVKQKKNMIVLFAKELNKKRL